MRKRKLLGVKNLIAITCIILSISFLLIQIGIGRLLEITSPPQYIIGEFGERVIQMLPDDLPFTLFLPSEPSFYRDLRMNKTDDDNTYAILTRILGFSAVPRWISPADLDQEKEAVYNSISGFRLYLHKTSEEMVVANGIPSIGMKKKKNLVIHVMDGVIMDPEFEQSVRPPDEEN
ncbi:hypothetical protein M569_05771, partial [Genlisea aurea]